MTAQATNEMREKLFTMRISEEEAAKMDAVAERFGLTAADLIRLLINRADAETRTSSSEFDPMTTSSAGDYAAIIAAISEFCSATEGAQVVDLYEELGRNGWEYGKALMKSVPRRLNELRRAGYIKKWRGGYATTAKGEAVIHPPEKK